MPLPFLRRHLLGSLALATPALAQSPWPNRPVRIVVPYAAGGGTDTMARIAAQHLTQRLGQPFVVDNRPGANGQIASEYIARLTPDGYTLFFCGNTQTGIIQYLQPVNYDPVRDFTPVSIFGMNAAMFALHPAVPATSLAEFLALVRSRPGAFNYGSAGTGTISQLTASLWVNRMGLDIVHVPMRGGGQSVTEAMTGRVQMLTGVSGDLMPAAANGGLRIIAISAEARMPQLPDVPTLSESLAGFVMVNWNGFVATAGTPDTIVQRVSQEVAAIVRLPEVVQRLTILGITGIGNTPAEMAAFMAAEAPLLRAAAQSPGARDG